MAFVFAVPVLILLAAVLSYNRFVGQRNLIQDSWGNVDTELQRRYDLIPNLVETVRGYADHEERVLTEVARTRAQAAGNNGPRSSQEADEKALVSSLRQLFAVSEAYPDLKASDSFLALQRELVVTEDRIQASRRHYNANVRSFNRRVESIPSNLIAQAFGFEREDYFEVEGSLRTAGPPDNSF